MPKKTKGLGPVMSSIPDYAYGVMHNRIRDKLTSPEVSVSKTRKSVEKKMGWTQEQALSDWNTRAVGKLRREKKTEADYKSGVKSFTSGSMISSKVKKLTSPKKGKGNAV